MAQYLGRLGDIPPRHSDQQRSAELRRAAGGDAKVVLAVAALPAVSLLDVEDDAGRRPPSLVAERPIPPFQANQGFANAMDDF